MMLILDSLTGLPGFLLYFGLSLVFLMIFKLVYTFITPHDEWKLIKEKNTAAAVAYAGAFVGYSIAIAGAASASIDWVDYAVWGLVALIAQILTFFMVRFVFMPKLIERITNDEVPAAIVLAATSIAVGMLNAASMSF
uniref:DUF350 domain-containing protein n=1 Tax=Thaumasiovibrio occultus TaxID=1891184 RepID=UPI000B34DED2|nr:DUF350 domain-containing protein [Thaumasiovibrio occultus]